nr:MAG TPA: hypothetical protein [Caudoviricetes sp.]
MEDLKITGRFLKHITVHSPATIAHGNGRPMCYIETTNIVVLRLRWNERSCAVCLSGEFLCPMKIVMKLFTMTSFITVFLLLKNEHLSILKNKKNGGIPSTMIPVSQMRLRRKSLVVKSQMNPFACSKSLPKFAAKKMHGFLLAITFPQLEPRCAKESWQKNYQ